MLNKILQTVGSRIIMAIANLALLLVTTRLLGAEVKGQVSLFVLNVSVLTMISGIFAGPSLVYLTPRISNAPLLALAYLWSIIASISFSFFIHLAELDAGEPLSWLLGVGLIECLLAAHLMTLLGRERVTAHNVIQMLRPILTVIFLLVGIFVWNNKSLSGFIMAYGLATGISLAISTVSVFQKGTGISFTGMLKTARESWQHGFWIQAGSLAQLLNYRVAYYFLEILSAAPQALIRIGLFSAAVQVAESLWLLAKSVATVQYSKVSNTTNRQEALNISIKLIKFNYSITTLGCFMLAILPSALFTLLLGAEFDSVKPLTMVLIPGIIFLSISSGISHFFAGVGDNKLNAYTSGFGLIFSVGLGYVAVFYFSMYGAAIATAATYVLQTLFQIFLLQRRDQLKIKTLFVNKADFLEFKEKLKNIM